MTASYLGAVERGEKSMTLEKLIDLIKVFEVSMDYILSDFIQPKDDNNGDDILSLINNMNEQQRQLTLDIAKLIKERNI